MTEKNEKWQNDGGRDAVTKKYTERETQGAQVVVGGGQEDKLAIARARASTS